MFSSFSLQKRLKSEKLFTDFSIDPKHEFAKFVWNKGNGTSLTAAKGFCSADESVNNKLACVTRQAGKFPECGVSVEKDYLFVAVKTCKKFHDSRRE